MALLLKSFKISFELTVAMSLPLVVEMKNQFLFSVLIDTLCLISSYGLINHTSELPMDKKNLTESYLPLVCMLGTMFIATVSASFNYFQYSESTNLQTMFVLFTLFALELASLFNRFGVAREKVSDEKSEYLQSKRGLFGSCSRKKIHIAEDKPYHSERLLTPTKPGYQQ